MRILITGSTGFIGGSVGRFAAASGHEVVGIARRSQGDPGWPGGHHAADVAQADLAGVIREVRPDAIFHGAGTASVAASFAGPLDDLRAALMTWANLLDGVRRSGLRPRVVFPSSAAVYGNPVTLPVSETAPAAPISPYGYHKLACELIAREYRTCFDVDVVVCRIFSVFGPAQRRLLLWELYEQFRTELGPVTVRGTGYESRDYLHVDDLSAGVLAVAGIPKADPDRMTFNLAGGVETRICDLAGMVSRAVGSTKPVVYQGQTMSGDPARWVADTTRTRAAIPGWGGRPVSDAVAQCVGSWRGRSNISGRHAT